MEFLGFTVDLATLTENALSIALKIVFALLIFMIGRWLAKKIVAISNRIMLTPVRDKPHCNSLILFTMWLPVPAEAYF